MLKCYRRHIPLRIAGVLLPLLLSTMLYTGCAKSESETTFPTEPNIAPTTSADTSVSVQSDNTLTDDTDTSTSVQPNPPIPTATPLVLGARRSYSGPSSLEERIVESETIARVKMLSVSQVVERGVRVNHPNDFDIYKDNHRAIPTKTFYIGALEFRFEVLEYLKGSGGREIVAVLGDAFNEYDTMEEAQAENLMDTRYDGWDNTESIVFLYDSYNRDTGWGFPSIQQPDRYELGVLRDINGRGAYSIYSRYGKNWLPAKEPEGASGMSGASSSGEQQFLTGGVPVNMFQDGVSGASGASGASGDNSVMTLSDLKRRIADLEDEVNAGDGSAEYLRCIEYKYLTERRIRYSISAGLWEPL